MAAAEQQQKQHKQQILIVDDSEMNRSILADMLGNEFEIIEAENGLAAVAYIRDHESEVSLVLLDIVMPEMDGFEVLAVMNKRHWIDSVPVIMISAETVPTYVDRAYDLGVTDYINRPFDGRIVRRRVMNTIMLYAKQKKLTGMVTEQIFEKEKNSSLMIEILSNIVEFRNGESGLHVLNIHSLTERLLKHLVQRTDRYHLSRADIALISNASALHDIGKIAVPEHILNKPGKLTPEEFAVIKTHSAEGAAMLERIPLRQNEPLIQVAYQICRWHHERWDGRGYPDGLKGDDIPIAAQVVALADVYDALSSARVYKPAYSHEESMRMILAGECGAFNPLLLSCFSEIGERIGKEMHMSSLGKNTQMEMRNIAEELIERGEINASDRTLRLLEQERIKYRFFATMSREVQFEYTTVPDMVVFSEWGARQLDVSEILVEPCHNPELNRVIGKENLLDLERRLGKTTPESPIIEHNYLLNIRGQYRWCKLVARTMWTDDEPPEYNGLIGKFVDIHEEYKRLNDLENLASHDTLTGLLNHASAERRIESELAEGQGKQFALVFFDLDNFKNANDRFGHLFGDCVLRHVAQKITRCIRCTDVAARVGGDEFLIFMEYTRDVSAQVERIFHTLVGKYENFPVSVSMGVSLWPENGEEYEELFHRADQALYASKRAGKNRYSFYEESMDAMLSVLSPIDSDGPERSPRS